MWSVHLGNSKRFDERLSAGLLKPEVHEITKRNAYNRRVQCSARDVNERLILSKLLPVLISLLPRFVSMRFLSRIYARAESDVAGLRY